jgi:hypothetical protein
MGGIMFQAWLFVMGAAMLVIGAIDYKEYRQFKAEATPGKAVLASRAGRPALVPARGDYDALLKYRTEDGQEILAQFYLPKSEVDKLVGGGAYEFQYLRSNPRRRYQIGEELPKGGSWMIGGVVLLALFGVSLKLKRS